AGLKEAERLRDEARSDQRGKDFRRAMDDGQDALKKKDYRAALRRFGDAVQLKPGDAGAAAQSLIAQAGQARVLHEEGKAHFEASRYDEAVTVLTEAGQFDRTNKDVANLLKDAERLQAAV